jgi:hypothetical protein
MALPADINCERMNGATMHHNTCLDRQAQNEKAARLHKTNRASRLKVKIHALCQDCRQGQAIAAIYAPDGMEVGI